MEEIAGARYTYIRAFEDYVGKGQFKQAVECGTKATALYYKENYYKEAFDLLRRIDQTIIANKQGAERAALQYQTNRERMRMYVKLRKSTSALEQLTVMQEEANSSNDEEVKNDLLYQKAITYYTFGQNAKGDAVFKEMASKLTASKEYDKVDAAYQSLITNGRKSGSANLVAQSYRSYLAWKDSVSALKAADEVNALKKQIADNEASIAEKDSSLTTRMAVIIGLGILAAALAVALVVGAIVLLRFILLTRKQKKLIQLANDNNALKAKFISNMSAQLNPTLKKLDARTPEVKALLDFSEHVHQLSELENSDAEVELEETQIPAFCEGLMDQIRDKVKNGVTLTVNAPKMSANINKEYVSHILLHLLKNAAIYTPANGKITLDFKKRSAHTFQFLVTDSGEGIPEEKREDVFKPFLEIRDLTTGDGLGLPICKQMALKMDGDLTVDPEYTKGTRFVLALKA
ncbi:MAG: sensor histidine kinase [Prevotella sp.]|nr:sensor histidine kinase [Prevotella sp.]